MQKSNCPSRIWCLLNVMQIRLFVFIDVLVVEDCVKIVSNGKISLSTVYCVMLFKEVIVIDWKDSSPI